MNKKQLSPDVPVGIVLLLASAFLMYTAFTKQSAEARQFPVLILVIFMILAAAMVINGIKDTKAAAEGKDVKIKSVKIEEIKYPMIVFAFTVIYVVAVDLIGFIIPSLIFCAGVMWFNYARNKIALVAVPVGLVGFLYVLFTFILKTKLP